MATSIVVSAQRPQVRTAVAFGNQSVPTPVVDWPNGLMVTVGGTTASSGVIDSGFDRLVELCSTTNAWYTVAASPTAQIHVAGSHFIPAGQLRYVYVPAAMQIALIQDTAGGFASILPALNYI